jgi:transposase InsO family protein
VPHDLHLAAIAITQGEGDTVRAKPYIEPDTDERKEILQKCHDLGHFGASVMVRSIREDGYNWTNIHQDALSHCQRCESCLRFNAPPKAWHRLRTITAALPLEHVAVDLAGPFPTSRNNNHFLHVLIDVHSRFVLLKAIPDKRMETIAALWLDIFTTFGFPKIIQSDNGTEFVNQRVAKMVEVSRIEHRLISPYHPRANGVAERAVQTATQTIKKLLDGAKHQWDAYVPFVQYCLNQKIAERHRLRPFSVMFGRQANGFADFTDTAVPSGFESSEAEHEKIISTIQERIKIMKELLFPEVARRSTAKAAKEAVKFNKKHKMADIPINSYVMVRDELRKSKLDPKNEGPYQVICRTRGGSYYLKDHDGQMLPRRFPPSAIISLSTSPTFAQDSFEVEKIIDHMETGGTCYYKVRWKHYPPEEDTWEPEGHFDDHAVIDKYWKAQKEPDVHKAH